MIRGGPEAALVVVDGNGLVDDGPSVGKALGLPEDEPVFVVHLDDVASRELQAAAPPPTRQRDAATCDGHVGHGANAVFVHLLRDFAAQDERHVPRRDRIEYRAP